MTQNTKIEWADHTFNPWWGCTKISPACDNCYAAALDKRTGGDHWGADQPRKRTSAKNWLEPVRWNKHADAFFAEHGRHQRVFCASMADVFDNEVDPQWRIELFALIAATPRLDWLLLTKRIGNAQKMLQEVSQHFGEMMDSNDRYIATPNIWLGATICNQEEAERDIPKLLAVPAAKRFLSIEPMLGAIDLERWLEPAGLDTDYGLSNKGLDWVICGGESGHGARPMHPDWARSLRGQCDRACVPFFFKQWGEWAPFVNEAHYTHGGEEKQPHTWVDAETAHHGLCWLVDDDGSWSNHTGKPRPSDDSHEDVHPAVTVMGKHGKKAAGRELDGMEHDGAPT